jgi:hypothetical protein
MAIDTQTNVCPRLMIELCEMRPSSEGRLRRRAVASLRLPQTAAEQNCQVVDAPTLWGAGCCVL